MPNQTEIVITGIGIITPLGCGRELTWAKIKEGKSLLTEPGAEISDEKNFRFVRLAPIPDLNGSPRIFPLAMTAVQEALTDSSLNLSSIEPERIGCSVSVSKPILPSIERTDGRSNFFYSYYPPDSVGKTIAQKFKLKGPRINVIAACATGIHSLLHASRWLKEKKCDAVIAGSVESSIHPLYISGFQKIGVLSDFPCPFDQRRNGFMMAEGAGILILERKSDALKRKSKIYAELLGCAIGGDVYHPTSFDPSGASIASVINQIIQKSGILSANVNYINSHGTGTVLNDWVETKAIKKCFKEKSYNLSLSSTKASTGHLLGASGSVEAAISCLAIRDQFVPPTLNLEIPDPECDLDYTPFIGKKKEIKTALSLSFGFGGHIGALIFGRI